MKRPLAISQEFQLESLTTGNQPRALPVDRFETEGNGRLSGRILLREVENRAALRPPTLILIFLAAQLRLLSNRPVALPYSLAMLGTGAPDSESSPRDVSRSIPRSPNCERRNAWNNLDYITRPIMARVNARSVLRAGTAPKCPTIIRINAVQTPCRNVRGQVYFRNASKNKERINPFRSRRRQPRAFVSSDLLGCTISRISKAVTKTSVALIRDCFGAVPACLDRQRLCTDADVLPNPRHVRLRYSKVLTPPYRSDFRLSPVPCPILSFAFRGG